MPIVSGQYQSPAWVNDQTPAIDASELNDLCGTVEDLDSEMGSAQDAITALQQDMSDAQEDIADAQADIATLQNTAYIEKTVSGSIASFADGAALPVKDVAVQIVAKQSGEGDPSPTNIRPITGFTGAVLCACGANVFNGTIAQGGLSSAGGTTTATNRCRTSAFRVRAGMYTVSCAAGVKVTAEHYYTGTSVSTWIRRDTIVGNPVTFTVPDNCTYLRLMFAFDDDTQDITPESVTNVMVNVGSSALPYVAYSGSEKTIIWQNTAGTVYGVALDALVGDMKLTHGFAATNSDGELVDFLGNVRPWYWSASGDGYAYAALPFDYRPKASTAGEFTSLCNRYKEINNTVPGPGVDDVFTLLVSENDCRITFRQTSIPNWGTGANVAENAAIVKNYFASGNQLQLAWKIIAIAEPITYNIAPVTDVATQHGDNTMWFNRGDIAVTYRADPSLVIAALESRINATQNIIAGVETSMVATQNYSIGDLLIVGDALYKATAAIANGANITVGTNVAATTVAEQLLLLANA